MVNPPFLRLRGYAALVEAARARPPDVAVVLGSGMGDVARRIREEEASSFLEVPGLLAPSVAGHTGRLCLGDWAGKRALVFEGRLHHYEGHPWRQVVAPVPAA